MGSLAYAEPRALCAPGRPARDETVSGGDEFAAGGTRGAGGPFSGF